jgi:hypothetical protein
MLPAGALGAPASSRSRTTPAPVGRRRRTFSGQCPDIDRQCPDIDWQRRDHGTTRSSPSGRIDLSKVAPGERTSVWASGPAGAVRISEPATVVLAAR